MLPCCWRRVSALAESNNLFQGGAQSSPQSPHVRVILNNLNRRGCRGQRTATGRGIKRPAAFAMRVGPVDRGDNIPFSPPAGPVGRGSSSPGTTNRSSASKTKRTISSVAALDLRTCPQPERHEAVAVGWGVRSCRAYRQRPSSGCASAEPRSLGGSAPPATLGTAG